MPKPSPYPEAFEERWLRYRGEKDGKKLAKGYWNAEIRTEDDIRLYDQAEANYYAFVDADHKRGFKRRYKGGKTWFNNWLDYVDQEPPSTEEPEDVDFHKVCQLFHDLESGRCHKEIRGEAEKMLNNGLSIHSRDSLNYILEKLETNNG